MPRAFLITNKRYNSSVDYEENNRVSRENSPERGVSTAEEPLYRSCDSETDSIGFETFKPTSPHSPAHQSRSLESSPSPTPTRTFGHAVYRPNEHVTPPPSTHYHTIRLGSPSSTSPQRCSNGIFRSNQGNTASALVTVIRQLMQQQQQPSVIRTSSPDSSSNSSSRSSTNSPSYSPSYSPGGSSINQQQDNHVCNECGKRYSTSSNLARHRQTHRSVTDKKARKCPHCDKVYVSMPAYSMHVRTHSQGCQCPYCGKCFSRPWLLQGHIRTHTGEKPFTCPVCRKAFADKSNLRAHIQTHSSSKPYVCQRCGKAFALKSYLYKHEESSCMRIHRQQQQHQNSDTTTILDLAKSGQSILLERNSAIVVG